MSNNLNSQSMNKKNYKKQYAKKASAGEGGESAQDRALNLFAEMMISKIESIMTDWRKPWFTEGLHSWQKMQKSLKKS